MCVLSCRPCCLFSLWELPYLSVPAEAPQQCSIAHWKSGCLTRTTEQLWLWMYPWARAHAIKIKLSTMTGFSWILKTITTETHPHWQNSSPDKVSGLKHRGMRAFQTTIKNAILLQEETQLFLLMKTQIHPIAAAKTSSAWQSSAQQKQTSTQGSTGSYAFISQACLALLCTVAAKHCTVNWIVF